MESLKDKISPHSSNMARYITLLGSVLVALSSGTNYIYSAYAPQLGARLRVSHTQQNIIGLAANMGGSISGPVWGRIVDHKGPSIPLVSASICLLVGYLGIKQMYDDGIGGATTVSPAHLTLLVVCSFMTGLGSNAGLGAALNTTAKSFPPSARATTTGLVLSGFGLSAFWFSLLANTLFPGDTSAFLLTLALGTAIPMFVGLFIVKPVPLPSTSSDPSIDRYDSIPTGEGIVLVGIGRAVVEPEAEEEEEADFAPLLSHEQDSSSYQAFISLSAVELSSPANLHHERRVGDKDALPDVHGKQLWLTPDFYLIFMIISICGGTGLMYINNVGSISQALYAKTHAVYDEIEAAKWQAAQVSILSLGNFAGRVLIGLISDFAYIRVRLPRAYCLCIVSFLFIISQVVALIVSTVEMLWIASLLLGLAYGSLFGTCPTIMIEWFGMTHFSENWGFVTFSPMLGGNLFSLMFGRYLDAHALPSQNTRSLLGRHIVASMSALVGLGARELPSEHQCFDGKACYLGTLQVTLVACVLSLGLSWWAGVRDGQMVRARSRSVGLYIRETVR